MHGSFRLHPALFTLFLKNALFCLSCFHWGGAKVLFSSGRANGHRGGVENGHKLSLRKGGRVQNSGSRIYLRACSRAACGAAGRPRRSQHEPCSLPGPTSRRVLRRGSSPYTATVRPSAAGRAAGEGGRATCWSQGRGHPDEDGWSLERARALSPQSSNVSI